MKFELVKEELSTLLSTLVEQFETMDAHQNTIPQIEIDIFTKNIQVLYEQTALLKKSNSQFASESLPIQKAEPKVHIEVKAEIEEKVIEEEQVKLSQERDIEEKQAEQEIEISDKKEDEIAIEKEESSVEEFKAQKHIESSFDDILEESTQEEEDLFSHIKASQEILDLNKKLAEARGNHSLAEKLQNLQIESLKSVIGINDKFYFINELFNGEAHKYEDVIYTLNNFKRIEDAMQYFSTLKYRFSWAEESEAAEKLVHMLERKFNVIDA